MTWIAKLSDYDRDADRRHARKTLARMIPFGEWSKKGRETVASAQMWLRIVREMMKLAALTPEEHKAESARLELDAAIAFAEGSEH
jgi:hypothetical protein